MIDSTHTMKTSSSDTVPVPVSATPESPHHDVLQTPRCRFSLINDIPPSNHMEVIDSFQTPNELSYNAFNSSLTLNLIDDSLTLDTFFNQNHVSYRLQPRKKRRIPMFSHSFTPNMHV